MDNVDASSVKVLVTGPQGAGKTVFVTSVSTSKVQVAEDRLRPENGVALDFGRLVIDDGLVLQLFATHGQTPYAALYDVLATGLLGTVIMVDDTRMETYDVAEEIYQTVLETARPNLTIFAINKVQSGFEDRAVKRLRHQLRLNDSTPVIAGDFREETRSKEALLTLFRLARSQVSTTYTTGVM